MDKGVFRQGRSLQCLVHRGSFPGEISIDLVQKSVKLIIIIIKGHKLCIGINNMFCFSFVAFLSICIVTKGNKGSSHVIKNSLFRPCIVKAIQGIHTFCKQTVLIF